MASSVTTRKFETGPKLKARKENVRLYRDLTGNPSLRSDQQYWTLSSHQSQKATSEINQLVSLGLIQKSQFHGIDRDPELIEENRLLHPEAHFYAGEWEEVLLEQEDFCPGLVYLDTESEAGRITLNLTAQTMALCPENTVLLVNVCQSSRYHEPMETDSFLKELTKRVPDLKRRWGVGGVRNYDYACSKTLMRTYAFYKGSE